MEKAHWSRAPPGLKWPAKTWPSSYDHDHPHGHGWHLARCVCVCVPLAWRAMPQGAWAASEGPVCPQSLTICVLLVVIKVSNLEVSWGLAKRGQKMSLCCSSCWAAVTIFTYLYTLIVFALLSWHWGSQSFGWDGEWGGHSGRQCYTQS